MSRIFRASLQLIQNSRSQIKRRKHRILVTIKIISSRSHRKIAYFLFFKKTSSRIDPQIRFKDVWNSSRKIFALFFFDTPFSIFFFSFSLESKQKRHSPQKDVFAPKIWKENLLLLPWKTNFSYVWESGNISSAKNDPSENFWEWRDERGKNCTSNKESILSLRSNPVLSIKSQLKNFFLCSSEFKINI